MLHLRPRNRFEDLDGVYLVGGGTHPGSGLPVIYEVGPHHAAGCCCRLRLRAGSAEPGAPGPPRPRPQSALVEERVSVANSTAERIGVIGGGLGGLAAACTLAARGYAVMLFEKQRRGSAARRRC